jgi:hypothetical protein
MNRRTQEGRRIRKSRWSARSGSVPGHLLVKIGVAAGIVAAFGRAVWNPGDGLPAIAFWLLLFMAACQNEQNDRACSLAERDAAF